MNKIETMTIMRYFLFSLMTVNLIGLPLLAEATTDCATQIEIPENECKTLLSLFNSTTGAGWFDIFSGGWNITNTPCSWTGVTCREGHIVAIDRQNNGLKGSLPDLTNLSHLEKLDLSHNELHGPISSTHLPTSLQTLSLEDNQFNGNAPDLTTFTELKSVNLGENALTGSAQLPPSLTSNGPTGTAQFSETTYRVNEDEGLLRVTVKRVGGNEGKISVSYATLSESAKVGSDFEIAEGSLTWRDGDQGDKTFAISITDDTAIESNETFIISLQDMEETLETVKVTVVDNDSIIVQPFPELEEDSFPRQFYAPVCSINRSSINSVCIAQKKTFPCNVTIEEEASISQAVFECDAENKGLLSNSTIKAGATVRGGLLSGYMTNEGLLADFDFRGASIIGGTLSGTITNNSKVGGWFQDVHLAPNTHISGGILKGEITGDLDAPALLENLTVKSGRLSGVIIGDNVSISDNVVLGEGVE
jgi:acetyltransferase-like isoleucine patch superfamily enzyme